jgi:hypothetical protein
VRPRTGDPVNEPESPGPRRVAGWRRLLTGLLVVVSCVLAPFTGVAVFTRNRILSTDRYVHTVAPLASQQPIIDAVAGELTNKLFSSVNVQQRIEQALPSGAGFVAAPVSNAIKQFVRSTAARILESQQFRALWTTANRHAHDAVVNVLTGQGKLAASKALTLSNGKVYLDLTAVATKVEKALTNSGISIFEHIPVSKASIRFELFDAHGFQRARGAVNLLDTLATLMTVLVFAFLGVAVVVSPDRRRTLVRWGLGFAGGLITLLAVLGAVRSIYLNAVTGPNLPRDAAAAVYDTLLHDLRSGLRVFATFGLVVALVAYVAGRDRSAQRVRRNAVRLLTVVRPILDRWLHTTEGLAARYRTGLRIAGAIVVLVLLFLWASPTWVVVLGLVVALCAYLGLVEALARAGAASQSAATP